MGVRGLGFLLALDAIMKEPLTFACKADLLFLKNWIKAEKRGQGMETDLAPVTKEKGLVPEWEWGDIFGGWTKWWHEKFLFTACTEFKHWAWSFKKAQKPQLDISHFKIFKAVTVNIILNWCYYSYTAIHKIYDSHSISKANI